MFSSLWPHGLQGTMLPCPSLSTRVYSNSCPLSWWHYPIISTSVTSFSCPQFFPAPGSFPMSQILAWGGQSIAVSASASVLPINIQGWFPLGLAVSHSVVSNSVTPWTVGHQGPLSMGFPGQEYWSGLLFPSPGDLPNPGIDQFSHIAGSFFTIWAIREAILSLVK